MHFTKQVDVEQMRQHFNGIERISENDSFGGIVVVIGGFEQAKFVVEMFGGQDVVAELFHAGLRLFTSDGSPGGVCLPVMDRRDWIMSV